MSYQVTKTNTKTGATKVKEYPTKDDAMLAMIGEVKKISGLTLSQLTTIDSKYFDAPKQSKLVLHYKGNDFEWEYKKTKSVKKTIVVDGDTYPSKSAALKKFKQAMMCCDGSEGLRMSFAYYSILDGCTNINTYLEEAY